MAEEHLDHRQEYEYKAEMKQLLHLIIHSLYTHPEVFLRELISNASDALNKLRFLQLTRSDLIAPDTPLQIMILVDEKERRFAIEDNGIGMTRDDLVERIGTVASSGTLEFLKQARGNDASIGSDLIGKFGVGFYSVFMVADEVTIETRHALADASYRWSSRGEGTFTIEEIDRPLVGTRIEFVVKEEMKEFADVLRIRSVIQKYSNFVDFPIHLNANKINVVSAIWSRPKDEISEDDLNDFYTYLTNDSRPPLGSLHLNIEGRVNFKALLFIPQTRPPQFFDVRDEKTLHLYANRVFIQDNAKTMFPDYLRFVKGVVDTEDLPLNVSRELTQSSPVMEKIREVLVSRVVGWIEEWEAKEQSKFATFIREFGIMLKYLVAKDAATRPRVIELLRFESTKAPAGEFISFKQYVARMNPDQKAIYYLAGETRDATIGNPSLEYFRKNDIEVLLFVEPVDIFIVPSVREYNGIPFTAIDKADIELAPPAEETPPLDTTDAQIMIALFQEIAGDEIEKVVESKRLVDSPATLVSAKQGFDRQSERLMKLMDPNYRGVRKILEVNMSHPILKNLMELHRRNPDDPFVRDCVRQVFEGTQLIDDHLEHPSDYVKRMSVIIERATRP